MSDFETLKASAMEIALSLAEDIESKSGKNTQTVCLGDARCTCERSERKEEPERTICGRSGLRWGLEGARTASAKEVLFCGGSGQARGHARSERNEGISFCGRSGQNLGLEGARAQRA